MNHTTLQEQGPRALKQLRNFLCMAQIVNHFGFATGVVSVTV